jgi:hypothetical protein
VSALAQCFNRLAKASLLRLSKAIKSWIVRSREMGHHAVHANVLELPQRFCKLAHFVISHAEPSHPRINLEMNVCDHLRRSRRTIKRLDHIKAINHGRQLLSETDRFLPFPETAQAKNRLLNLRAS